MGVWSQLGRRVCDRWRPAGPVRTVRRGSRVEIAWVGERKSEEGGMNSEEGGWGVEVKSRREGPALRASEKVVCGWRRGRDEGAGSEDAVARVRMEWLLGVGREIAEGA